MLRALRTSVPDEGTDLPKEERIKNARITFCTLYRPLIVLVAKGTVGMEPDWVEDFAQWMLVQLLFNSEKKDQLMRKVVTNFRSSDEDGRPRRFAPYLSGYISNKARDFVRSQRQRGSKHTSLDALISPDDPLTLLDAMPWDDPRETLEQREILLLRLCAVITSRTADAQQALTEAEGKKAQKKLDGLRLDLHLLHSRSINTSSEDLARELHSTPNSIDVQRAKARRWLEADFRERSEENARLHWQKWLCRRAIQYLLSQRQLTEGDITALQNHRMTRFHDRRLKARELIEETMTIIQSAWMAHPFQAALSPDFGCFSDPTTP